MLKIVKSLRDLGCSQLLAVYTEQLQESTAHSREAAFYEDISLFFAKRDNLCCLWAPQDRYTACVRAERYRDGFLMTCLETAPECRRQGNAFALVTAVAQYLQQRGCKCVYVHVARNNRPSLDLHKKAGFQVVSDCARLIDGTVSQRYVTMRKDLQ